MNDHLRNPVVFFVAIAILTCCFPAQGEVYRDPGHHFSFQLPPGWRTMPMETLNDINTALSPRLAEDGVHYNQGFLPEQGKLEDSPYILLQWVPANLDGQSYEQIEREFASEWKTTVTNVEGALADIARDLSVGKPVVDRGRNRVVVGTQSEIANVGWVRGISFGFLGSRGIAFLHCYDQGADFDRRAPLFNLMAESFTFEPGYEFAAVQSGAPNARSAFRLVVIVVVLIGSLCAGLFRQVVRKFRQVEPVGLAARSPAHE